MSDTLAQSKARQRHTNWCFTFNYGGATQPALDALHRWMEAVQDLSKYFVAGFEVAPTTSQLHLQGYIQLNSRKRLSELRSIPDGSAVHWEPAVGDEVVNRAYCLKLRPGDTPNLEWVETGEPSIINPGPREVARWERARKHARLGELDLVDDQIYVQCYSAIQSIARDNLKMPPDADDVTGVWYYGLTGSGKSRLARETYGTDRSKLYLKPLNKWWDGYRGQPYVLLEDFGKDHACLGYHLKIWADRYAYPAEVKGSTVALRPQKIVVTSQYHPRDIWTDSETLDAITRRFSLTYVGDASTNPWNPSLVLSQATTQEIQPHQPATPSPAESIPVAELAPISLTRSQAISPASISRMDQLAAAMQPVVNGEIVSREIYDAITRNGNVIDLT